VRSKESSASHGRAFCTGASAGLRHGNCAVFRRPGVPRSHHGVIRRGAMTPIHVGFRTIWLTAQIPDVLTLRRSGATLGAYPQ
jgi:hypothetical protein